MDVLAHIIQTGNKIDVCHILCSVPGIGKDLFLNYFGLNILGSDYYLNMCNITPLESRMRKRVMKRIISHGCH